jgi:hypothetical protein
MQNSNQFDLNNENDLTNHLFNICIKDDFCKHRFYQHNSKNITLFNYLIKDLLYQQLDKYEGFYINWYDVLSLMIEENNNNNNQNIIGNYVVEYNDDDSNSNNSSINNELLNELIELKLLYTMSNYQANNNDVVCYPGQKLIVSEDGLYYNCICEENHNCSQSVFDMTYVNLCLALLIVLAGLITAILAFRVILDWNIYSGLSHRKRPLNNPLLNSLTY